MECIRPITVIWILASSLQSIQIVSFIASSIITAHEKPWEWSLTVEAVTMLEVLSGKQSYSRLLCTPDRRTLYDLQYIMYAIPEKEHQTARMKVSLWFGRIAMTV